jgi:hypothetical protein
MKIKDITEWSDRWLPALATMDANAPATVLWILAGLLALVLYPGCTAIENNRPIRLPSNVQASQAQKDDKTQWASNAQGTLFGENMGDFIILQWSLNDSATEYFVYRSTSPNGPREQTGRFSQGAARTGGAKIDDTPDVRLMDLCYKVEAIDAKGLVIEFYEPICVPKFVP